MKRYSELRMLLGSRWGIRALALLAAVTVLVLVDHWAHADERSALLSGLLGACIIMPLFLHDGHGRNGRPGKGAR